MTRVPLERYQLLRELPPGGVGVGLDAIDPEARGRRVLVKRLPPLAHEADRAAFEALALALDPLRHASVLSLLAHGLDGDAPFLAFEAPEAPPLRALITEHLDGAIWPELSDVRAIVEGVCAAVAVAHRMRVRAAEPIVHGLLSAHSVFARRAGADTWEVAVTDFGLARLPGVDWRAAQDDVVDDPRSPEQLADRAALSPAGDVFALGVLAVALLVPFPSPTKPRSWARFVETQASELRTLLPSLRPDLPPALCLELSKALSPLPRDRHPDAERLRLALRRVRWEPTRELPPPPQAAESRSSVISHVEVSSPQFRLPAALVAEAGPGPHFLRTASAPRATPAAPPAESPPAAPPAESTVPAPSAIAALRAIRRASRAAESAVTEASSDRTVVAPAPERRPPRRAIVRARTTSLPRAEAASARDASSHPSLSDDGPTGERPSPIAAAERPRMEGASALPSDDLFSVLPWRIAPVQFVSDDDSADDEPTHTAAPGSPPESTLSEADAPAEEAPRELIDQTRIGRLPPAPARAHTLPAPSMLQAMPREAPPSIEEPTVDLGVLPLVAPRSPASRLDPLLVEATQEALAPAGWNQLDPALRPDPPRPPPRDPTHLVVAGLVAWFLVLCAVLAWALR